MTTLVTLKGVGRATAKRLKEQGFTTVESLPGDVPALEALDFNESEIAEILSIQAASATPAETTPAAPVAPVEPVTPVAPIEPQAPEGELTGELGNVAGGEPSASTAPQAVETLLQKSETQDDEKVSADPLNLQFVLKSGPHKGRTATWREGDPAIRFLDGAFASLETLNVNELEGEGDEGMVEFSFNWGPTTGRGALSKAEFDVFAEAVRKKPRTLLNLA